ncbi:uncharacterized protein LOC125238994 [Leguminivora glycinivorella]|uniref:uncharacterized protein LOC125238994 n=1 Tax=Leguminivora glycinivorella TaxID=1035111 RepID=UPI00200EB06E|nr:uncharacterized protein LOC125238994 [Leguminivora glycinivorella]
MPRNIEEVRVPETIGRLAVLFVNSILCRRFVKYKWSDSECSVYTRTPSPEPKKIATKNIKKRKSSSAARSEVETENRRVLHSSSPTPCAQKKKTTKKARTSTSENKNVGSSSSKKSPETDIFKIIREEEKITSEGSSKTVKTTSSFTSRVSTGSSRRTTITDGFQKMADSEDIPIPFSQYAQEFELPQEFDDSDLYKKIKKNIENPKAKKRNKVNIHNKVVKRTQGHPPSFVINNHEIKGNKLIKIQIINITEDVRDQNDEQNENVLLSAQYVAGDNFDEIIDSTEALINKISKKFVDTVLVIKVVF